MNSFQNWGEAISMPLLGLWDGFIAFVPSLLIAIIVFVFGLIAATILGEVIEKIIRALKVDNAIERINFFKKLKEAGLEIKISIFFKELVRWFLILAFLMAATDILGLYQVTDFLSSVVLYFPNIIVATIILSIAFILGNFVYEIIRSSIKAAGVMSASLLAAIAKWAIIIFGLLAAMVQLGIATSLINTLFIGVVAALSLATGLAFGLGGREEASLILKKVHREISDSSSKN